MAVALGNDFWHSFAAQELCVVRSAISRRTGNPGPICGLARETHLAGAAGFSTGGMAQTQAVRPGGFRSLAAPLVAMGITAQPDRLARAAELERATGGVELVGCGRLHLLEFVRQSPFLFPRVS